MREKISRFLAILLCAALIIALPCAAFADGEDGGETPVDPAPVAPTPAETEAPVEPTSAPEQTPAPEQSSAPAYTVPEEQVDEVIVTAETVEDGVLDSDELKELIENFLDERGIAHDRFRLGYTYTGTNETWYYNGDVWSYSASVYKLPLMMMLAQKVANGELKQDDKVCGVDLTYAETSVLTYSNNDYAHVMIHYFDSEQDYREQQVKMSDVPVEDIPERYYISSHFSPRFVIGVLRNLYENPDQFPNIVECLKVATPGQYLSRTLGDEYEVAQKYGAYEQFNNIAGIVYMPHPILIAINTTWVGNAERVLADAGKLLADYTLTLDARLEEREKAAKAEEERKLQEEETERKRLEEAAAQAEEEARIAEAQAVQEQAFAEEAAANEAVAARNRVICAVVAVVVIAAVIAIAVISGKKKKRRRAAHRGRHSA